MPIKTITISSPDDGKNIEISFDNFTDQDEMKRAMRNVGEKLIVLGNTLPKVEPKIKIDVANGIA